MRPTRYTLLKILIDNVSDILFKFHLFHIKSFIDNMTKAPIAKKKKCLKLIEVLFKIYIVSNLQIIIM